MRKLRFLLFVVGVLLLTGCGYTSRTSELVGQAKKLMHVTPLICADHDVLDVSLGVMRGGVGSMSTQDILLLVPPDQVEAARKAVQAGALVRVLYDVKRCPICFPADRATLVQAVEPAEAQQPPSVSNGS